PDGLELELDAKIPDSLRRLDEGASDVVIADQAHAERNAGLESIANCGGNTGVRNGNDNVGVDGMFLGEQTAKGFAAFVDAATEDDAVGARKIDVLEDALLAGFFGREMDGFDAGARDAHHFAGRDFANILRVEEIERAGFASDQAGGRESAEIERAQSAGVADGVEFVGRENEERVSAFDLIEGVGKGSREIAGL